ncbi:metal-dependent hydrolase [Brevibacterium samyangense]|uniref:Amidohydrolase n=1 Tax=Brevibacterium samyangense TaxID=366888 RepID=A0ABP5F1Z7_9MICO
MTSTPTDSPDTPVASAPSVPGATVLCSGDVYSSVDPFATAIAFDGPTVTWVGSDEAAAEIAGDHVDLGEDFVAPGFVAAGLDLREGAATAGTTAGALVSRGIVGAHVIGTPEAVATFTADAPAGFETVAYVLAGASENGAEGVPTDAGADSRLAAPVAALDRSALPARPVFVLVDTDADLGALLDLLGDASVRTHFQRSGYRVLLGSGIPTEAVDVLAASGVPLTLDPKAHGLPLAALFSAGAQITFALDVESPWSTLSAAVFGPGDGVSARAAFNAVTRFAHRAVGRFDGGVLAPGASASMNRWVAADLVVQVADERLAAWSTDPRSGTPGLPDLSDPQKLPQLRSVWVQGTRVLG